MVVFDELELPYVLSHEVTRAALARTKEDFADLIEPQGFAAREAPERAGARSTSSTRSGSGSEEVLD